MMRTATPKNQFPKRGLITLAAPLLLLGLTACLRIYTDGPGIFGTPVRAATATASPTPQPLPTAAPTATRPARIEAVVKESGAEFYHEPGLLNVEHFPAGRLAGGARVVVNRRTASGAWLEVVYLGQAGLWVSAEALDRFTAAPEGAPVSTEVFATMDASEQAQATQRSMEMTLLAQGVAPGYAAGTAQARLNATATPKPPPFPVVTGTPPANCAPGADGRLECRTAKGVAYEWGGGELTFERPDQLQAVQQGYARYLDLVMGRAGPPSQDFSERLRDYMVPAAAMDYVSHDVPGRNACTYGDIVKHVAALLAEHRYLRITPAGKLVWDRLDFGNRNGYLLSFDYNFTQRGHFDGSSTVYEVVDTASGNVVRRVRYPLPYAFQANLVYVPEARGWRITFDDYCDGLSWAGVW